MTYLFYANSDNKAAVSILSDLSDLSKGLVNAEFLSPDSELETFCSTHDLSRYSGVINLDLCGYGDTIVFTVRGRKSAFTRFTDTKKALYVSYLPECEEVRIFRKFRLPVLSLAIVPKWDVQYLKALSLFGPDRLLGQPPEFALILSQMEVSGKTHETDAKAMKQVYDYIYEAMTSPEPRQKNFLRRLIDELF